MNKPPKPINTLSGIAGGCVLPYKVEEQFRREQREKQQLKEQRRHDYMVALFGCVGGGVMGFLTSLLFWLITK